MAEATPSAPAPVAPSAKPAETPVAPVAAAPESKEDFLKPRFDELAKQTKRVATERRQVAQEREAFAKDKAEFEAWRAAREDRRRNPAKYLEQDFGQDWYDKLTEYKVSGTPTASLIASELDEREAKLLKRIEEKEAGLLKRMEEQQKAEEERSKAAYLESAVEYAKANSGDYFWISEFGEHASVAAEIERHFIATTKQLPDGSFEAGELLSAKQAADKVEGRIGELVKKAQEANSRREAKSKPAAPEAPKRNESPQRRTLSTDMTAGSAAEWTPPKDDGERLKRSIAAWEAQASTRQH